MIYYLYIFTFNTFACSSKVTIARQQEGPCKSGLCFIVIIINFVPCGLKALAMGVNKLFEKTLYDVFYLRNVVVTLI